MARPSRHVRAGLVVPLAIVTAWQVLVDVGALALDFLPAPDEVLTALAHEITSGELTGHLAHTLLVTVAATGVAMIIGGALGLGFGLVPALRINAGASVDFLRTIPAVALMPIAMLSIGPGPLTQLLLAAWAAQWPILINTAGAVAGVHPRLYDVGRMLRFSPATTLRKIVVPALVPAWLVGGRLATIVALHVTITAEMVMAPEGLGGELVQSLDGLNVPRVWAYAVTCGIVGGLLNAALRRLVRHAQPAGAAQQAGAGNP